MVDAPKYRGLPWNNLSAAAALSDDVTVSDLYRQPIRNGMLSCLCHFYTLDHALPHSLFNRQVLTHLIRVSQYSAAICTPTDCRAGAFILHNLLTHRFRLEDRDLHKLGQHLRIITNTHSNSLTTSCQALLNWVPIIEKESMSSDVTKGISDVIITD